MYITDLQSSGQIRMQLTDLSSLSHVNRGRFGYPVPKNIADGFQSEAARMSLNLSVMLGLGFNRQLLCARVPQPPDHSSMFQPKGYQFAGPIV